MNAQLNKIAALAKSHPGIIAMACFDPNYFHSLTPELQKRLLACVNSGIENPDSDVGCYACQPEDYDDLDPFFSKVISRHHGIDAEQTHISNWDTPDNNPLDLSDFGLGPHSLRIRVGRNFGDLPLTSAMTKADRLTLEARMCDVFRQLSAYEDLAGTYVSLTPGHQDEIDQATYKKLVSQHIMFKDMSKDGFLMSAGIATDWPHGRGCYISNNSAFIVWVGEEDHLRIMVMQTTTRLKDVLDQLKTALETIQRACGKGFARSPRYGAVTTCPTNLGTGMRASIHLQLPNLVGQAGSIDKIKAIAASHGLAARGFGGEHTPVGTDGTVDISPKARLCVTEGEIVSRLYCGIGQLIEAERQQAES